MSTLKRDGACYMTTRGDVAALPPEMESVAITCRSVYHTSRIWLETGGTLSCDEYFTRAGRLNERKSRYYIDDRKVTRAEWVAAGGD